MNVKNKTREELTEIVRTKGTDNKLVVEGIELSIREDGDGIDLSYGNVKGFLLKSYSDMSDLYIHQAFSLKDALQYTLDVRHVANIFDVDLVEGKVREVSTVEEFDQRDITIAKLEAQITVYKSMLPSTDKVTYQREIGY